MTLRILAPLTLFIASFAITSTSSAQSHYNYTTCCTITDGLKLVNEEHQCSNTSSPENCCRRAIAPRFGFGNSKRLVNATEGSCSQVDLAIYNSPVEACTGPTTFSDVAPVIGNGFDAATNVVNVEHAWIRTPQLESGQGSIGGSKIVMTEWQDHTGYGEQSQSTCRPVAGCDVRCVENAIMPGRPLGLYGPTNMCQNAVVRTLANCGCYDTCVRYNWLGQCAEWTWPPLGGRSVMRSNR